MRRVAAVLSTAAMVMFAASVFAQAPNFAGKWTADTEKNAPPAGGGGGGGGGGMRSGGMGDMTITQDAKTLTLERGTQKSAYNLDGSDSSITMPGRNGGEPTTVKANAKWDGSKLVITTHGANGDTVQTWYMEGTDLVREQQGRNGLQKTYYKKAS